MAYSLWRHGVLLGHVELTDAAGGLYQGGELVPSEAFAAVWTEIGPTFAAAMNVFGVANLVDAITPETSDVARTIDDVVSANRDVAKQIAAFQAVDTLGLELRDEGGRDIGANFIMVNEVRPPSWLPAEALARQVAEARELGFEVRIPSYHVVVPRR